MVVNRVRVAGPRTIVITLPGDSVMQYDPVLGMIRAVFHPGISMNVGASRSRASRVHEEKHGIAVAPLQVLFLTRLAAEDTPTLSVTQRNFCRRS